MWDTRNQQAPPHARKPKQWDGYADHGGFDDDWGRADARRPKSAPRDDRGGGRREDDFFDEGRRRSSEFSRREGDFLAGGGGSSAAAPRSSAVSFFDDGKQRSSMDRCCRTALAGPPHRVELIGHSSAACASAL